MQTEVAPECEIYEDIINWDGMTPENPYCQEDLDADLATLREETGNTNFDYYTCPSGNPCVA